jgi:hypothetical protein
VDYIHAVEDQLGIPRPAVPEPAAEITPTEPKPTVEGGASSEESP